MGKLFVLGRSGAGKTPVAKLVAERLGVPHIGASDWVRRNFSVLAADASESERQAQIKAMTDFSTVALKENPNACLDVLWGENNKKSSCVVEGMRNPFDLIKSFDSREDFILILDRQDNNLLSTTFESGLDVIDAAIAWLITNGIATPDQLIRISLSDVNAIDSAVDSVVSHLNGRIIPNTASKSYKVHAPIESIPLFVQKEILYGGDIKFVGELVACKAFCFSSYPGSVPTLNILLDNGAMFACIAPQVLRWQSTISGVALPPEDLYYHLCPSGDIAVNVFPALAGDLSAYFKHSNVWMNGKYGFTIDWYEGNDMLHFILLDNGQVAFVPQHKIKFGKDKDNSFPAYKKLRDNWSA